MKFQEGGPEVLLKDFPVVVEIRVAWGEMDALNHVNNTVFFRYFENARVAYIEQIKFWELMDRTGVGPILASTKCRFMAPLTYPDKVFAGTRLLELGKDRLILQDCVVSERLQRVVAKGESVLVCYDYRENRKVGVPEELRRSLEALEGSVHSPAPEGTTPGKEG